MARRSSYTPNTSGSDPVTKERAQQWLDGMRNVDGSSGAHWTCEQAKSVLAQKGYMVDPVEFWAAINMIYSDYSAVAKRLGVDNVEFYAAMADAFLQDPDVSGDKLYKYITYVK